MRKIFYENDGDMAILQDKTIAIIGYGNQGRAQALNMRDSGLQNVIIGNIHDLYRDRAEQDGFPVMDVQEAARKADVILILIPDEEQPGLYSQSIQPELSPGKVVNFASGYNIAFQHIVPPKDVDVTMVAPRMIGDAVRRLFETGRGFPAFLDVFQNATGHGWEICLALARAIGALRTGSMAVSFAEEAWMDLLTEQATIPLIFKVLEMAFDVQVQAGLPPEAVLLEMYMSGELAEVFERAASLGLFEQMRLHSHTSQYGQLTALGKLDGEPFRQFIQHTLVHEIQSGEFAKRWQREQEAGMQNFDRLRDELLRSHRMAAAERHLRDALGGDFLQNMHR